MLRRRKTERPVDRLSLNLTPFQYERSMAVPWRRALLRFKPPKMTMGEIYEAMGWKPGILTSRSRFPDLRVSLVGRMADVIGADRGAFAAAVIEELEREA
jgi:hypothetical protein